MSGKDPYFTVADVNGDGRRLSVSNIDGVLASSDGHVTLRCGPSRVIRARGTIADVLLRMASAMITDEERQAAQQRATEMTRFGEDIGRGIARGVYDALAEYFQ